MTTIDSSSMNNFFLDNTRYLGNSTPPMHQTLVASGKVASKNSLYAIIGSEALTNETFDTLLCEIEQFLITRPITAVSSSPCEIEALNPNHFLLGKIIARMPPKIKSRSLTLMKQWKFAQ